MLKLSYSGANKFAVPGKKYILKTKSSSDFEIMTYLGNGRFKRDLFGLDIQGFKDYVIEQDDTTERYIVPLDLVLKSKSAKDLMEKKDKSKYIKSYSFFMNVIKKEFKNLKDKTLAEFVDGDDVVSDSLTLKDIIKNQCKLSLKELIQKELSELN
jgi:hypothetical protein